MRYVILHHEGVAHPHFDLMVETGPGSTLASWRLNKWPVEQTMDAERLADHRREYLDYEGPVSGNRGVVRRVEAGKCEILMGESEWQISAAEFIIRLVRQAGDAWRCERI